MKEYIERAAAIGIIKTGGFWEEEDKEVAITCVEQTPAADVVEVRHGSWIFDHMTGERAYYANCSECGNRKHFVNQEAAQKEKYCSLCGARMDKEDNRDKHTLDE